MCLIAGSLAVVLVVVALWPFVLFAFWLKIICFTFGFVARLAAFYANSYQLAAANGQLGRGI